MKKAQVVDGRIAHANGLLELRLSGAERAQAHADILSFTDPSGHANGKKAVYNQSIVNILRRDPSLLLEPIPKRYPLGRTTQETWANADSVWRNYNAWYGTWLSRLLDPSIGCDEAVELALRVGIHPDDENVWPEKTLLASEGWATNPVRLELALRHGANPDFPGECEWGDGYLQRALNLVRSNIGSSREPAAEAALLDGVRCAELLLDAGAMNIDPPESLKVPRQVNFGAKVLTAIGSLTDGNGTLMTKPNVRAKVFGLAEQLHRAGADMDRCNGILELPPVVQALRCLNIEFACHLVRMGCKTDDASIVRPNVVAGTANGALAEEAYKAGKEAFTTKLVAAAMERQIALTAAGAAGNPANDGVAEPARRRRMRVM